MKIKDFIDFVKYTPQNTNPNIIGSILDRDINGSINKAKEYTDSQRIAYEEYKQFARLDKDNSVSNTFDEETEEIEAAFDENRFRIVDKLPGRRILRTPISRPKETFSVSFIRKGSDEREEFYFGYNNYQDMLNKNCFIVGCTDQEIWKKNCPSFFKDKYYDALVYAFETTSDNMGMGLTAQKGWYAVNSNTFDVVPFDIDKYPVVGVNLILGPLSDELTPEIWAYLNEVMPLTEELIYDLEDGSYGGAIIINGNLADGISYAPELLSSENPSAIDYKYCEEQVSIIIASDDNNNIIFKLPSSEVNKSREITIYYSVIHQFDKKYFPVLDELIINGQDGNKYKLIVNESGELVPQLIEGELNG